MSDESQDSKANGQSTPDSSNEPKAPSVKPEAPAPLTVDGRTPPAPRSSTSAHAQSVDDGWDDFDPDASSLPPPAPQSQPIVEAAPQPVPAPQELSTPPAPHPLSENESPTVPTVENDSSSEDVSKSPIVASEAPIAPPKPRPAEQPRSVEAAPASKNDARRTHDVRAPRVSRSTKDSPRFNPQAVVEGAVRPILRHPRRALVAASPDVDAPVSEAAKAAPANPDATEMNRQPRTNSSPVVRSDARPFPDRSRQHDSRGDGRGGREDSRQALDDVSEQPNRWRISRNASGMPRTASDSGARPSDPTSGAARPFSGASQTGRGPSSDGRRDRGRGPNDGRNRGAGGFDRSHDRSNDARRGDERPRDARPRDDRGAEKAPLEKPPVAKAAPPIAVPPVVTPVEVPLSEELRVIGAPRIKTKGAKKDKPKTAKEAMRARAQLQMRGRRPGKTETSSSERAVEQAVEQDSEETESVASEKPVAVAKAPPREKKFAKRAREAREAREETESVPEPTPAKPKGVWQRIKSLFGAG